MRKPKYSPYFGYTPIALDMGYRVRDQLTRCAYVTFGGGMIERSVANALYKALGRGPLIPFAHDAWTQPWLIDPDLAEDLFLKTRYRST